MTLSLFLFLFCVAAYAAATETLAVLPFENNSLTDAERYGPLAKGFAAMLTTDMGRKVPALKMVERTRIDALLRELQLGMSGVVDEATAVRAGRILGAQHIAFGCFMVLEGEVRMDIRIIRVETSEVIAAECVTGKSGEILTLINRLAGNIAASFRGSMAAASPGPAGKGKLDAALFFSRGVEALDRGLADESKAWFDRCLKSDPLFRSQIESLQIPN
jgi:TolB-like protein